MNKTVKIDICGKSFPMAFTIMAGKKLIAEYGDIENIFKGKEDGKSIEAEDIGIVSFLLETMIRGGVARERFKGAEGVPDPLTAEEIESLISFDDLNPIMDKVNECMNIGSEREVMVKDPNKLATQTG